MNDLSNKETTLLGLLAEEPMHAYKIEHEIKERAMREWTEISVSSVYKLLRKMERDGLISSDINISKNNLTQKIYAITPRGEQMLKDKIIQIISEPEKMIYRIDLATSNLNKLTKEEAITGLNEYRQKLHEALTCYQELENYLIQVNCPTHSLSLARRPQHLISGEIEWINEFIEEIQKSDELSKTKEL